MRSFTGKPPGDSRLVWLAVRDFPEMRALIHAAQVHVCTRRRPSGFPVKLLNYMEAALPIVAYEGVAAGIRCLASGCL